MRARVHVLRFAHFLSRIYHCVVTWPICALTTLMVVMHCFGCVCVRACVRVWPHMFFIFFLFSLITSDDDVDLDALLADLIDMEKDATVQVTNPRLSGVRTVTPLTGSIATTTAKPSSPPASNNGQDEMLGDDEFSKLMAEMEELSTTVPAPAQPRSSVASTGLPGSRASGILQEEIAKLGGGAKVSAVNFFFLSHSVPRVLESQFLFLLGVTCALAPGTWRSTAL